MRCYVKITHGTSVGTAERIEAVQIGYKHNNRVMNCCFVSAMSGETNSCYLAKALVITSVRARMDVLLSTGTGYGCAFVYGAN